MGCSRVNFVVHIFYFNKAMCYPYPHPWILRPIPIPRRKVTGTQTLVGGYEYIAGMGPGPGKNTHGLPMSFTKGRARNRQTVAGRMSGDERRKVVMKR